MPSRSPSFSTGPRRLDAEIPVGSCPGSSERSVYLSTESERMVSARFVVMSASAIAGARGWKGFYATRLSVTIGKCLRPPW
jgi:hypothetical protein